MQLDQSEPSEKMIGGGGIEDEWRKALDRAGVSGETLRLQRTSQRFDVASGPAPWYHYLAVAIVNATSGTLAGAIGILILLHDPKLCVPGRDVGSHTLLREQRSIFSNRTSLRSLV